MNSVIPISSAPDFNDAKMRLTQSETGHVHSPWFTLEMRPSPGCTHYDMGSRWHAIIHQAKSAFSGILKIPEREVVVVSRPNNESWGDGDMWRLQTSKPCDLPKPPIKQIDNPLRQGAIDI